MSLCVTYGEKITLFSLFCMTGLLLLFPLCFFLRIGFLFYRKQELQYVTTFIQSARRKKYKKSALGSGSESSDPPDADPGGPKTYRSDGIWMRTGFGTLVHFHHSSKSQRSYKTVEPRFFFTIFVCL